MRYQVQFTMPIANPVVKRIVKSRGINDEHPNYLFEVPLNYQDAHNLGFQQLIELSERGKILTVSTALNKTGVFKEKG